MLELTPLFGDVMQQETDSSTMKPLRLKERFKILRDRLYFHVVLKEELDRIDGKLLLLLDHQLDIRTMKPAIGDLRLKQEVCFQMLRILKRIAKSESISFWLDFGTLLGAVRHGGFVPWDDDLDISLANPDYTRFCDILPSKLPPQLVFKDGRVLERKTGFYVDLYPYERVPGALRPGGTKTEWENQYQAEYDRIVRIGLADGMTETLKQRIVNWHTSHANGDGTEDGVAVSMLYFVASPMYRRVYAATDIYPFQTAVFEGEEFLIPRNSSRVLSEIYGDILRFPRDAGAGRHGQTSVSPQVVRAVIDELNEIVRTMDNA